MLSRFSSCLTPDVYLCLQSNVWFDQICNAWEAGRLASNNSSLLETVNVFIDGGDILHSANRWHADRQLMFDWFT